MGGRSDLLNDPHEGTTPRLLAILRDQQFRDLGIEALVAKMPEINQQTRKTMYVSCWHLGNSESEAMWRLYCPDNGGVAIQTTYGNLVSSIDHDPYCYIGTVTYIDYETQGFPLGNIYYPIMHKRISFAHESEVRLVKSLSTKRDALDPPAGVEIDWVPETTIETIFVNPYAPEFYYEVVCSILSRYMPQLSDKVRWSPMRASPVY